MRKAAPLALLQSGERLLVALDIGCFLQGHKRHIVQHVPETRKAIQPSARNVHRVSMHRYAVCLVVCFSDPVFVLEIQYKTAGGVWTPAKTATRSSTTVFGLPTGALVQIRIRAIGPNDLVGEWSDPIEHLVP